MHVKPKSSFENKKNVNNTILEKLKPKLINDLHQLQ